MGRKLSIPEPLAMTPMQHEVILQLSTRPTTTLKLSGRARILLLGVESTPYSVISKELGVDVNTVKLWQNRWIVAEPLLSELQVKADLEQAIHLFFKDLPRSGAPKKFSKAQEKQIVALACDRPDNHDVEMTDWSHGQLATTAQSKGIVASISPAQVGRILKNRPIKTA